MSHLVFVYGTLKKGSWNHHLLATATFQGYGLAKGTLYDLGGIPGFVRGDRGDVRGELYLVDDETLANLDILEGYNRANPGLSLYQRVEVEVMRFLNIEEEDFPTVHIYEINQDISTCEPIKTGEW